MSVSTPLDKGKADWAMSQITKAQWSQKLSNEMMRNVLIYGTSHPHIYKKATLWERFKWRVLAYKDRVREAWLVLTGKAEIYDGQDD